MASYSVLTNNPLVRDTLKDKKEVIYKEISYEDVCGKQETEYTGDTGFYHILYQEV